jgi:hypothetical protein
VQRRRHRLRHRWIRPRGNPLLEGCARLYRRHRQRSHHSGRRGPVPGLRLRQAVTRPAEADLAALAIGERSVDFGRSGTVVDGGPLPRGALSRASPRSAASSGAKARSCALFRARACPCLRRSKPSTCCAGSPPASIADATWWKPGDVELDGHRSRLVPARAVRIQGMDLHAGDEGVAWRRLAGGVALPGPLYRLLYAPDHGAQC